jgi:histidinol-phosphate aminotransferase
MECVPSYTNFIFVNFGVDAGKVAKDLLRYGIVICAGGIWGFPTFARITVGTMEQNAKLIQALKKIIV